MSPTPDLSKRSRIAIAVDRELARAEIERLAGDASRAFTHLERAHILSQRFTRLHVRVHWEMWRYAARQKSVRELLGQTTRILAAAVFSRLWVPVGNTGGANVSAFRSMPVPDDLAAFLDGAEA